MPKNITYLICKVCNKLASCFQKKQACIFAIYWTFITNRIDTFLYLFDISIQQSDDKHLNYYFQFFIRTRKLKFYYLPNHLFKSTRFCFTFTRGTKMKKLWDSHVFRPRSPIFHIAWSGFCLLYLMLKYQGLFFLCKNASIFLNDFFLLFIVFLSIILDLCMSYLLLQTKCSQEPSSFLCQTLRVITFR